MTDIITISALLVLLAAQQYLHYIERKDLCNRLMSRDLVDYKNVTNNKPPPKGKNFVQRGLHNFYNSKKEGDN